MRVKSVVSAAVGTTVAFGVSVGVLTGLDRKEHRHAVTAAGSSVELASERLNANDAIAFWKRRVERNPRDYLSRTQLASQCLRRARELHNTHDAFEADAQIDRVLQRVPADIPALLVKANARSFVHDFSGSRELARRVLGIDRTHSTAIAVEADDSFELGDLRSAARGYRALARRFGTTPEIGARLARLRHAQGNDAAALQLAQDAVNRAIDNDYLPVDLSYFELLVAELQRGMGHYDAAAAAFEQALAQRPDYGGAIEGLGKVRAEQGRYDESERLWRRSGALIGTPDFHVLSALGDLQYARGHELEARRLWKRALVAVGSLTERERIGFLRDESRFRAARGLDPQRALQLARQDLRVRPDAFAYDTLAWAQFHTGDVAGAEASMHRALGAGVHDAGIWYHAAAINAAAGRDTSARQLLRRALDLNPEFDVYEAVHARALLDGLSG
jgi:tetratricopeptide (TPR) repeat protein